ncbi:MAG: hypothetical protein IKR91_06540 [Alloprevotella sp.]|nr:hypothetical protein [Alloprevotella sp.]
MKRLFSIILVCFAVLAANAQFESGTKYVNGSLTGLGLSYSKKAEWRFGIQAEAGYYFADSWMARVNAGYEHTKATDDFSIGAGVRYHFLQNGIFLGAGVEYNHYTKNVNDVMIPVEVGYTFYLNHYIAIEPAVYYKMSTNDFADGSTVGLRIGLGYYF